MNTRTLLCYLSIIIMLVLSGSALAQVPKPTSGSRSVTDRTAKDTSSSEQWIDVQSEPKPITPVESLVVYPDSARVNGLEGKVTVQALVEKDGSVIKAVAVKGEHQLLNDAAVAAFMKAKYTPAISNGQPIRVWITQTISFRLHALGK